MAVQQSARREVIDVRQLGNNALLKTDHLEVVRVTLPAGKVLPTHTSPGEMTVHCLEGRVIVTCGDRSFELSSGGLLHLLPHEPHSVRGIDDALLLLTIVAPEVENAKDEVQEASEESFPASDPPAWTGVTRA